MRMQRIITFLDQSEPLAKAATSLSITGASFAWLGVLNEILTAIATTVAIISGLFAIRFYYAKYQRECDCEDDETK